MKVLDMSGEKTWVVLAKYRLFTNIPEKSGIIRVNEFQQACVMQSDGKVGARGTAEIVWTTLLILISFTFTFFTQPTCTTMTTLKECFQRG